MRQCPILMYHWFRSIKSPSFSRSSQLEITPHVFELQMKYLKDKKYQTVPLQEAVFPENESDLPSKPIVITFDDGTLDFWEFARPVLQKYGFNAVLFIVTGYVGKESTWDKHLGEPPRPLMSWDQIAELHRAGFEIGSHTHTHRSLTELTDREACLELKESREVLMDKLGTNPEYLAYPRGFYEARHKQMAREAGYNGACAVILKWRDLLHSDRFELKRMTIKGTESINRFGLRLQLSKVIPFTEQSKIPCGGGQNSEEFADS